MFHVGKKKIKMDFKTGQLKTFPIHCSYLDGPDDRR